LSLTKEPVVRRLWSSGSEFFGRERPLQILLIDQRRQELTITRARLCYEIACREYWWQRLLNGRWRCFNRLPKDLAVRSGIPS
jgi:hypothetical protein